MRSMIDVDLVIVRGTLSSFIVVKLWWITCVDFVRSCRQLQWRDTSQ